MQAVRDDVGRCYNGTLGTYTYVFCTNGTGAAQRGAAGNRVILGTYLGWSNARQNAGFGNGTPCTLWNGWTYPRSAYASYHCGAATGIRQVTETGEWSCHLEHSLGLVLCLGVHRQMPPLQRQSLICHSVHLQHVHCNCMA